jgi:hypothetical protein
MKRVALAAGLAALLLASTPAWAATSGLVRVHNRTDSTVTVYVLNVDFFGNRSWRALGDVSPRALLDLPNVPTGTMVGVQTPKRQWPPRRVEFTGGRPIFEYIVTP